MPVVETGAPLSSSWYCPGAPAASDPAGGTGVVSVLNPGDTANDGTLTVYPSEGEPKTMPLAVGGRARVDVRLAEVAVAPWAAAIVELIGAEGVVEQSAAGPTGRSTTACANSAGSTWYFAEGATTVDASLSLLLFNPFPDDAILDLSFTTTEGTRQPQATQGYVVRGQSVRLLTLDDIVRREPIVATTVSARNGRVVAGRVQTYAQGQKRGFSVSLASPVPADQWWFASGDKGDRAAERISLFNPGDLDAEVDVAFYPADPSTVPPDQINTPIAVTVPAKTAISVDVKENADVPAGQHSILVQSEQDQPVVAERVLELQGDTAFNVTLQPGSPLTATSWTFVTGAADGSEALVVANATGQEVDVTVRALGPAGFMAVSGLESVKVPAAGTLRVDLDEKGLAGLPIIVDGTVSVVAERVIAAPAGQLGIGVSRGIPTIGP